MSYQDERKFIHDLANPLGTAIYCLETVLEDLEGSPGLNSKEQLRKDLKSVSEALQKATDILTARRLLIKQSEAA
jgi:hypothetical protein